MDVLKEKYNAILNRIKNGQKCCEKLDLSKEEDLIKRDRYLDKIIELLDEGNRILLDIEQFGTKITEKEINNGFKI